MARWKTIESAPRDRSILVDGGMIEKELYAPEVMTEPVKVSYEYGKWHAVDTCGYSVIVIDPIYWTDLPTRALSLELPRPEEYDL